ncbi:MAG TPA: cysteine desulfurase family protein [Acidimicrobiales bacterium]|nr:cysteine desulfurase family protein [Acidimicrobiales bacterium]HVC24144.1 cysteine desulfurase family protein [Acidimicrobiales bacterium]
MRPETFAGAGAYLDHAATTPMRAEAIEAMLPYLAGTFANPSGAHGPSRAARRALDAAREELAAAVGCSPDEVVFTSGGTESDNLAVLGTVAGRRGAVLTSAVEHRAVLAPARTVGGTVVPVDGRGLVDLDEARAAAERSGAAGTPVTLASLMLVNSETGVVQPVAAFADAVRAEAPGALVHTDAAQALTWLDVSTLASCCDLVTISGHKFGGPKGIGALVVRERAARLLRPVLHGGGQERELRAGTPHVAGAVAMGAAATLAASEREATVRRVAALRDRLADGLVSAAGAVETAPRPLRVAGSCHLRFPGVAGEELVLLADRDGVSLSTGSACASGAREPSHVLLAMGLGEREAREAVRISLGATTSADEVEHALAVLVRCALHLAPAPPH